MQAVVTGEEMKAAARQLAKTPRGREGLARLLELLQAEDFRLGLLDRAAFLALLQGAWDGHADVARASIEAALEEAR